MPRPTFLLLAVVMGAPVGGCDLDPLPAFERDGLAPQGHAHPRPHHEPPPPMVLLRLAVELGGLTDDPEVLRDHRRMHDARNALRDAEHALGSALADAIASGEISVGRFDEPLSAIAARARDEAAMLALALDDVHGRLAPTVRGQVVAALPQPTADGSPGPEPMRPPPLAHLLEPLDLDSGQVQALREARGEPPPPPAPPSFDLHPFAEPSFDASGLDLADIHAEHVTERAQRTIELLAALLPVLDGDQRATLEDLLRTDAAEPVRTVNG